MEHTSDSWWQQSEYEHNSRGGGECLTDVEPGKVLVGISEGAIPPLGRLLDDLLKVMCQRRSAEWSYCAIFVLD